MELEENVKISHSLQKCKKKFSIRPTDFFGKCDQIRSFLRIWSHSRKNALMENFIFCAVIGNLEINSVSNKFEHFEKIVKNKVDILILTETKWHSTFSDNPVSHRNVNGAGVLIYVTKDISRKISSHRRYQLVWGKQNCWYTDYNILLVKTVLSLFLSVISVQSIRIMFNTISK